MVTMAHGAIPAPQKISRPPAQIMLFTERFTTFCPKGVASIVTIATATEYGEQRHPRAAGVTLGDK